MKVSEAAQKAGGITPLSQVLECSRFAVHKWIRSGRDEFPHPWLDVLRYRRPEWFTETSQPK